MVLQRRGIQPHPGAQCNPANPFMPWSVCFPTNVQIYHPITFSLIYGFILCVISFSLHSFLFLYHRKRNLQRRSLLNVLLRNLWKLQLLLSLLSLRKRHHFLPKGNLHTLLLPGFRDLTHQIAPVPPDLQNCSYLSQCQDGKGSSIQRKTSRLCLDSTSLRGCDPIICCLRSLSVL